MKKLFIISLIMLMALTACAEESNVDPITEETEETKEPIEEETTEQPEGQVEEQPTEESKEPIENDTTEQLEEPIENETIEEPEEQTETEITEEVRIDTGKYSGMIDANSFEVQISGVPESVATRVFMLTDESREIFDELKLETDDEIKIHFYVNEHEQMVVVDIEKLN